MDLADGSDGYYFIEMALRKKEFIPLLAEHAYSQLVAGHCWLGPLAASLDSSNGNGQRTSVFELAQKLGTTKKSGTTNRKVAGF